MKGEENKGWGRGEGERQEENDELEGRKGRGGRGNVGTIEGWTQSRGEKSWFSREGRR